MHQYHLMRITQDDEVFKRSDCLALTVVIGNRNTRSVASAPSAKVLNLRKSQLWHYHTMHFSISLEINMTSGDTVILIHSTIAPISQTAAILVLYPVTFSCRLSSSSVFIAYQVGKGQHCH